MNLRIAVQEKVSKWKEEYGKNKKKLVIQEQKYLKQNSHFITVADILHVNLK